ncbi:MAG: indolepyruvate oxidoreductase subunit beta [Acidobacteria bacterium]|nr:indolepyruvate oxidoreductase subunit beta [Acidobacteriota bacterium]
MANTNILLVGVGGQGILLASEVMSEVFRRAGLDVKKSEVHGMAQRGGVVSSHVRFGEKVYSPMIEEGDADILLSFELMEALRWEHYLKPDAFVATSNVRMVPPICNSGKIIYPDNTGETLKKVRPEAIILDIENTLKKVGNTKVTNVIMLGVLSTIMEFQETAWLDVVKEAVPPKLIDVNINAFAAGRELLKNKTG